MSDNSTDTTVTMSGNNTHATTVTVFGTRVPFDVFSASYAILVATGGILGYVKAKSVPSLAAGLTFGALIGTGSYLEATQENYWVTLAGSSVLGVLMTQRFIKSRKFMPSGLVSALSIGMVVRTLWITSQQGSRDPKGV